MKEPAEKLRSTLAIHPPLVAAFPVLSLFSTNLSLVPPLQLWRPLAAAVAIAMVAWVVFAALFRSWERGALAASASSVVLLAYEPVAAHFPTYDAGIRDSLIAWSIGFLAVVLAASRLTRLTRALNVLAAMLVVVTLGRALIGYTQGPPRPKDAPAIATDRPRPDIFYILVDGYGRTDALRRALGYDNAWFVDALRERGFFVADQSRANYVQTELSLASSLNMAFVQDLLPSADPGSLNRQPLADLIAQSRVARQARQLGYSIVTVGTGFPPVRLTDSDLHVEGASGLSLLESALVTRTPFRLLDRESESQFATRRKQINYAFAGLESLAGKTSGPRLVIAHILAPHPPFVFGPNGEPRRPKGLYSFFDGSDYMAMIGDRESYRKGYADQAEYLNRRLLGVVDRLTSVPGRRPVIILQGDHGSKAGLDQNDLAKTDLDEVVPILNAYLVPASVRGNLSPKITPVNSFRVVFAGLFGLDLPPLANRSWYSPYVRPYDFTDVTERLGDAAPPGSATGPGRGP